LFKKFKRFLKQLSFLFLLLASLFVVTWVIIARPNFFTQGRLSYVSRADTSVLKSHVHKLATDFVPRDYLHVENLNLSANYIESILKINGARVSRQKFVVDEREYFNISGEYGPPDGEAYVIGAHYDVDGEFSGADDNASGIAGLLELARLFSHSNLKKKVILVAFSLEEMPYFGTPNMGSYVYAKHLKEINVQVKLMISLEMIGYFTDAIGSQKFPAPMLELFYPTTGNFIAIVDQLSSSYGSEIKDYINQYDTIEAYSINAPRSLPGIDFSDHRSFWSNGFPAVMITDTSFYRNKFYHTKDDVESSLDFQKMAKVIDGVYEYIISK